jgi:hypothetical protein
MIKTYEGLGLSCMYPENWTLTEDTDEDRVLGFTVESPTSAFMTVTEYPWTVAPREALEQAQDVMKSEYDNIEYDEVDPELEIDGKPLADSRACDSHFYYLDLLVVSKLIAFTVDRKTFMVQIQSEDRDFQGLEMVFQAMLVSMLKSLNVESKRAVRRE